MTNKNNNTYIAIDLELEQPMTNPQTPDSKSMNPEIIQLGAVVFTLNETEPQILESACIHIKYDFPLSSFIKKLTSIKDEEVNSSEITVNDACNILSRLREKHEASRILVQWGGGDLECLKKDAPNEMSGFSDSAYNAKHLFQFYMMANNLPKSGGLGKSMGKLGLSFKDVSINGRKYGKHNALADSLNTAIIFNKLVFSMKR